MQETYVVTNPVKRYRMTKWGGAVLGAIGCGIGMSIAALTLLSYQNDLADSRMDAARLRHEAAMAEQRQALASAKETSKLAQTCQPIQRLAQHRANELARMQRLLAQFPAFKTEPYKTAAKQVEDEMAHQTQSAASLVAALQKSEIAITRCVFATPQPDDEKPLWKSGKLSLRSNGWSEAP